MFSEMTESVDRELHKPILLERDKYDRWYGDITYISRMHVATSRVWTIQTIMSTRTTYQQGSYHRQDKPYNAPATNICVIKAPTCQRFIEIGGKKQAPGSVFVVSR